MDEFSNQMIVLSEGGIFLYDLDIPAERERYEHSKEYANLATLEWREFSTATLYAKLD